MGLRRLEDGITGPGVSSHSHVKFFFSLELLFHLVLVLPSVMFTSG